MSDWTTALVVRDRLGQLRHAGGFLDAPITAGLDPLEVAAFADTFGPMEPILGRTGLPVATTVGDLTPRHVGRRVSVDGFEGELVALVALFDGIVTVEVLTVDDFSAPRRCTLDTPCEVLP